MAEDPALKEVEIQLNKWKRQTFGLRTIHAVLGIIAVVASLLVAAKINSFNSDTIEWFAFLAAVSTGLLTAFDLGSKANRMRRAWRKLNAALIKYRRQQINDIELLKIYEESEDLIGDVKENPV